MTAPSDVAPAPGDAGTDSAAAPSGLPAKAGRTEARWLRSLQGEARRALAIAIAAPLVAGVLVVLQAWTLSSVLDSAVVHGVPAGALVPGVVLFATFIIGRAVLGRIGEGAGLAAAERIKETLRRRLHARLMGESPAWLRARPSGALAAVLMEQVEAVDGFFARFLPAMIAAAVLPIAFAVVVMPFDLVAGGLFFITAPLIPLFMALVGWGAEAASRQHLNAFARLSGFFADRVRGITTLKLYGRADAEVATVRAASEDLHQRTLKVMRIAFLSSAVLEFFAALGVAGVALYIGLTFLHLIGHWGDPLTLKIGLFALLMAPEVYLPLRVLAAHYHDRANALAAVNEISAAFGTLPDVAVAPAAPTAATSPAIPVERRSAQAIDLETFRLRTPDGGRTLMGPLDLSIGAGETVALLGESGSGKSSLLEALARLRAFSGTVRIGGNDLETMAEVSLRSELALLGQRPHLFRGTIADNIRLGSPQADDDAVAEAARLAQVAPFAARLSGGLATRIGERGHGLSGGEAQRVALARIFLRNPSIILLDEPTAHLDAETEARVLDAVLAFGHGRTLIIATHSAAVAARAGRIIRIGNGGLHEPAAARPLHEEA